jgi:alpha/beta superfamily hydrolase
MAEKQIQVPSNDVQLEGLLHECPGHRGVVVTHPHPLYGGEMHNNVVATIARVYREVGFTTLRFNFRGVGSSGGSYGQGIGEQDDVTAAVDHLQGLGKKEIDLAGYSFGAWVNAMGLSRFHGVGRLIMVSPPVAFLDFSSLRSDEKIQLVIAGSRDDIGPPDVIQEMLKQWNPRARFQIIEGADHFYWGMERELSSALQCFLKNESQLP